MLPWISVADLQARLDGPDLRLVDVRSILGQPEAGRVAYAAGHLPGAVFLDLEEDLSGPIGPHGGRHPLPDADALARTLGRAGIDGASHVVAYDVGDAMVAGRVWWLLRWLGHDAVQVLDGGIAAWTVAGGATTDAVPTPVPARFVPRPRPELVVDRDQVRAAAGDPDVLVIDVRAAERYRGEVEPLDPVAGHVPGAVNVPYAGNLEDGRFRDPAALRERYAAAVGAREVIAYCGSGVSAAHGLMALAAIGLPEAKLYAGSWSDWVSYPDAPVALGAEP
ncbi:MAG: sulfurtransferase [Trueperaceae bacterium]|nr:sulfurtransferase [Trueperaceae bacterium]